MKFRPDWFLSGMVVATGLAWLLPRFGATGGALHPELVTKLGVALIFFLYGVTLPLEALKSGALHWRLHTVVQVCTFLYFPLLGILIDLAVGRWFPPGLRVGFLYLCVLPSTISSSVALTGAARGNVAGAIFNATLSSIIGVVLTPLWVGLLTHGAGQTGPLGSVMRNIACWLLLPMALGQLARPVLGGWIQRHRSGVHVVDRLVILLIIYTSFCDSVLGGVWSGHGMGLPLAVLAGSALLFTLAMLATSAASRALHFDRGDRIAAMFCGSKKTLASGVPMAKLIFGAHPSLGLILLPIMIYHPFQLACCGVLAQRWARETGEGNPSHEHA